METPADRPSSRTTTQLGSIAEQIIAAQLMLVSDGRLSPFLPMADDHGTDLLVRDKDDERIVALQIKARFADANDPPPYVQFDIRLATFREVANSYVLAALIDPDSGAFWRAWLIPATELRSISAERETRLIITPNPSPGSRDRYTPWRCENAKTVAGRLMSPQLSGVRTH
jgi:hypothetical protein